MEAFIIVKVKIFSNILNSLLKGLLLQILFSTNFRHIFGTFIVFDTNLGLRRELLVLNLFAKLIRLTRNNQFSII